MCDVVSKDTEVILNTLKKLRDEIDSAIETLEIMSDESLMEGIRKAEKDF